MFLPKRYFLAWVPMMRTMVLTSTRYLSPRLCCLVARQLRRLIVVWASPREPMQVHIRRHDDGDDDDDDVDVDANAAGNQDAQEDAGDDSDFY